MLTPKGVEAKARISMRFLKRKIEEYELLRREIKELEVELAVCDEGGDSVEVS